MWTKPKLSPTTNEIPTGADPLSPTTLSSRQRNPGRRFAQIVKLKPEFQEEYKQAHAKVWPDVLKQIKECNIVDCKFWLSSGFAEIFSSLEVSSFADMDCSYPMN